MTDEDTQPDMTEFLAEAVGENRRILGLPPQGPERYLDDEDETALDDCFQSLGVVVATYDSDPPVLTVLNAVERRRPSRPKEPMDQ